MSARNQNDDFMRRLDDVLAGRAADPASPEADRQALETARQLTRANLSADSRQRTALRQELLSKVTANAQRRKRRDFMNRQASHVFQIAVIVTALLLVIVGLGWAIRTLLPQPGPIPAGPVNQLPELPPSPVSTHTPIVPTASPIPTEDASASFPTWQAYESTLVVAYLSGDTQGQCEWEVLGRGAGVEYIWAMCWMTNGPTAVSAPAVVQISPEGSVTQVELPLDGSQYSSSIRWLFPVDIQERIFADSIPLDFEAASENLKKRSLDPSIPPLIVLSGEFDNPKPLSVAYETYLVQADDTLLSIASAFDTSIQNLITLNDLPANGAISTGQSLRVPSKAAPKSLPVEYETYRVQSGDTLLSIAEALGTPVEELAALNGVTSGTAVFAGQSLLIPVRGASASPPDGVVAFISARDGYPILYLAYPAGGKTIKLVDSLSQIDNPAVSPDGLYVAFQASSSDDGLLDIFRVSIDGSGLINLTNSPQEELYPAWSPDGSQIAYLTDDLAGQSSLYLIDGDGQAAGQALMSFHGSASSLSWSLAGGEDIKAQQLAFSVQDNGPGDIYTTTGDGDGLARLTENGAANDQPAWSPDGGRIVFASTHGDEPGDLWMMSADGSGLVNLTNTPEVNESDPAWSPDGGWITFVSDEKGGRDLYVINSTGANRRPLLVTPDIDYSPSWGPMAPGPSSPR